MLQFYTFRCCCWCSHSWCQPCTVIFRYWMSLPSIGYTWLSCLFRVLYALAGLFYINELNISYMHSWRYILLVLVWCVLSQKSRQFHAYQLKYHLWTQAHAIIRILIISWSSHIWLNYGLYYFVTIDSQLPYLLNKVWINMAYKMLDWMLILVLEILI